MWNLMLMYRLRKFFEGCIEFCVVCFPHGLPILLVVCACYAWRAHIPCGPGWIYCTVQVFLRWAMHFLSWQISCFLCIFLLGELCVFMMGCTYVKFSGFTDAWLWWSVHPTFERCVRIVRGCCYRWATDILHRFMFMWYTYMWIVERSWIKNIPFASDRFCQWDDLGFSKNRLGLWQSP